MGNDQIDSWNATLTGSHYKNKILSIDGSSDFFLATAAGTRGGNETINQIGYPIGSFYGYIADGLFKDDADVKAHAAQSGAPPNLIACVRSCPN